MNILITGGASGLGLAITTSLAKSVSSNIYFTFNSSTSQAKNLESKLENCTSVKCDFSSQNDIERLASLIEAVNIDILINNAISGMEFNHFHKIRAEKYEELFKLNIMPIVYITQAAIKIFRKKRTGKIITILSDAIVGNPPAGFAQYAAEKSYLFSLCKSWAVENIKFNISSNCISPAFMQTGLTTSFDERIVKKMQDEHPLRSLLQPDDVARAVQFLVNSSSQTNGINLILNAGQHVV